MLSVLHSFVLSLLKGGVLFSPHKSKRSPLALLRGLLSREVAQCGGESGKRGF